MSVLLEFLGKVCTLLEYYNKQAITTPIFNDHDCSCRNINPQSSYRLAWGPKRSEIHTDSQAVKGMRSLKARLKSYETRSDS